MMARPLAPVLLAAAASSASAQPVPRAPAMAEFAACAARQAPGLARALMATEMGTREEERAGRQLFLGNDGCLRGRIVLSSRVGEVRGMVAEVLLESDPAATARLSARAPRLAARASVAEGRAFVDNYARCLADADPAKSVALLATEHQSRAEYDAMLAFGDTLNDCMPMTSTYRIDRSDVRNHIAARLYLSAGPALAEGAR